MNEQWGLLGPETLAAPRRTRGLGLRATVRKFNDLAVPGLGNVWFCKQIFLALLGVAVAENARACGASVRNIEVTNSVEALACWLGYKAKDWGGDQRLRGRLKLPEDGPIRFAEARKRSFYVTQPMRMSTVQTLPALGLVEAGNSRFNSFRCTREGRELLDAAITGSSGRADPAGIIWEHKKWAARNSVVRDLTMWVLRDGDAPGGSKLKNALSPVEPLSPAAKTLLRHRFTAGSTMDAKRRRDALAWVGALKRKNSFTWEHKPREITEEAHWHDLEAGAFFFALRDDAIAVLDAVESAVGSLAVRSLAPDTAAASLADELAALEEAAERYLAVRHEDDEARTFARECRAEPAKVVAALVKRDGQVLQLRGGSIVPGPAFRGTPGRSVPSEEADDIAEDVPQIATSLLPPHISGRIYNLLLLRKDLEGSLIAFLEQGVSE